MNPIKSLTQLQKQSQVCPCGVTLTISWDRLGLGNRIVPFSRELGDSHLVAAWMNHNFPQWFSPDLALSWCPLLFHPRDKMLVSKSLQELCMLQSQAA